MSLLHKLLRSQAALALGLLTLTLAQTGCAHPVLMEPSVVVQARVGGPVYGAPHMQVYGQFYGGSYAPAPVVVSPASVWLPPPPPVVMVPRPYGPGWRGERYGHGHERGHGWGHRGW
jgi:hypothetical protein